MLQSWLSNIGEKRRMGYFDFKSEQAIRLVKSNIKILI